MSRLESIRPARLRMALIGIASILRAPPARGASALALATLLAGASLAEARSTPRVVSGMFHSCALTSAGTVNCWGQNDDGRLGDGTTTDRRTPVAVSGLTGGIVAIAAGSFHSCALTSAGGVKCWGDNGGGQLGDGTTTDRRTPVAVSGLASGVVAIAGGSYHTCALTSAGAMKCWGLNHKGQVGDGSNINSAIPVAVSGLSSGVAAIAAGGDHSCALTSAGAVKCWGTNEKGQLGDGTKTNRLTPIPVSGLASGVVAIGAGFFHSCAVTSAGAVRCWGANENGQLGDGTKTDRMTAVPVSGLASVAALATGFKHTCGLTAAGAVKCWGSNAFGELGDGTKTQQLVPVSVLEIPSGIAAIAAGNFSSCALTAAGGVKCWGYNGFGQLGDGTTTERLVPVHVLGLTSAPAEIDAGAFHTCARTPPGGVKCWGHGGSGQLGNGTKTDRLTPAAVSGLTSGIPALAAGGVHSCAITAAGGVKCWGENGNGQVGDHTTTDRVVPTPVSSLEDGVPSVLALAGGDAHSCALISPGWLECWGYNGAGQLGDGTTDDRHGPNAVLQELGSVAAMTAGLYHTCELTSATGAVHCWGSNSSGQLGNGTTEDLWSPPFDPASGLESGVDAVAAGGEHTCALTATGAVKCWGDNAFGQLGDATTTDRHTPTSVISSGVVAIATGAFHTCVLTTAGGVKCWGLNLYGQLGDGTTTNRHFPGSVRGLGGVVAIAAGAHHTCALTRAHGVKCWGRNQYGQLGDGTTKNRLVPVAAVGFPPATAVLDLGAPHGVWGWSDARGLFSIHPTSPEQIAAGDVNGDGGDDLVVDFGGTGLWIREGETSWVQIHTLSPKSITTGDLDGNGKDEVVVDFGAPYGIYVRRDSGAFPWLHPRTAKSITTADLDGNGRDDVVIDFGDPDGIWVWRNETTWKKLHDLSARSLTTLALDERTSTVAADLGAGRGIWLLFNEALWLQLHPASTDRIVPGTAFWGAGGGPYLIADFDRSTPWTWPLSALGNTPEGWLQLHPLAARSVAAQRFYGSAADDVIIDFGPGIGIWIRKSGGTWPKLHDLSAEQILAANLGD